MYIVLVLLLTSTNIFLSSQLVVNKRSNGGSTATASSSTSTNNGDNSVGDELRKKSVSSSSDDQQGNNIIGNNDDSHLRLYYKSNSPGRSVSHELEHRFVKMPTYQQYNHHRLSQEFNNNDPMQALLQQYRYQQPQPQSSSLYDPRVYLLNQQLNRQQFGGYPQFEYPNAYPSIYGDLNRNRQMMLNYNGNPLENFESSQLLSRLPAAYQHIQQIQRNQQQSQARNNLLRYLLLSNAQQQSPYYQSMRSFYPALGANLPNPSLPLQSPYWTEQSKSEKGLQYKIVHLKFKIEPQQGRLQGHGFVESDTGAGPVASSGRFSVIPRELPDLVRRLLDSSSSSSSPMTQLTSTSPLSQYPQPQEPAAAAATNPFLSLLSSPPQYQLLPAAMATPSLYGQQQQLHSSLIQKRQQEDDSTSDSSAMEKRSLEDDEADVESSSAARRSYEDDLNDEESQQKRSDIEATSNDDDESSQDSDSALKQMSLRSDSDNTDENVSTDSSEYN